MRHINRLPEPDILAKKHNEWQINFEKSGNKRPDSSKYGNPKIREILSSCSSNKCFYCEGALKGEKNEIDHYIEVSSDKSLAYTWSNLYLACENCNNKIAHEVIPVTSALDPCTDSDEEIKKNISFSDEQIFAIPDSPKGEITIKKFKLDSEKLDLKRSKWLLKLAKVGNDIRKAMKAEKRDTPNEEERIRLKKFTMHSQPYSLMCELYINKNYKDLIA